jgi:hypothetical protein
MSVLLRTLPCPHRLRHQCRRWRIELLPVATGTNITVG